MHTENCETTNGDSNAATTPKEMECCGGESSPSKQQHWNALQDYNCNNTASQSCPALLKRIEWEARQLAKTRQLRSNETII